MRVQSAPAMAATREALQQRAAFPHRAAPLVWPWPGIAREARLVGLIGLPVDVAGMMLLDEHLPLGTGEAPNALAPHAGGIQHCLASSFAIHISARIYGISQHIVDRRITRVDPAYVPAL